MKIRHSREEVIRRTVLEFQALDDFVSRISAEDWARPLGRPESKDPWTVKDALAHITYWKAGVARSIRKQRRPPEERGLQLNDINHLVYTRWHDRSPQEVLDWHRQVQEDVLAALREAPDEYFTAKDHAPQWPYDLTGHSIEHRVKDIQRALNRE